MRAFSTLSASVLLAGLLSACVPLAALTQAPLATPEQRVATLQTQWLTTRESAASAAPDLARWWQRYGDSELEHLVERALTHAPDVQLAQARLQQVRASRALADAALLPQLSATASTGRNHSQGQSRQSHSLALDASWEASIFGGNRDLAAAAHSDVEASQWQLAATRVTLAAEVAREYMSLRSLQQRWQITTDNLARQQQTMQLVDWRHQAGLASTLQLEQARSSLASGRATLPALESAAQASRQRLALLTGEPPALLEARLQPLADLPAAARIETRLIPAQALAQRPDVRAAEWQLKAEWQRLAARRAEAWPGLALRGSLGWQAAQLAALGGGQEAVRSLLASFSLPLFDAGRTEARMAQQAASLHQAEVQYGQTLLGALTEAQSALAELQASQQRLAARHEAATAAAKAVILARDMYGAGLVDFQVLLDSERSQLGAAETLVSARADVLQAQLLLYKVLGGGWQEMTRGLDGDRDDQTAALPEVAAMPGADTTSTRQTTTASEATQEARP